MQSRRQGWHHHRLLPPCMPPLTLSRRPRARGRRSSRINFIAKFDIDDHSTDLALEAEEYDTAAFADYQSWMLLAPKEE